MVSSQIKNVIEYPNEERHIEFKRSNPWEESFKAKITKAIIAMSNLRDGGWIVVGKEEQEDRSFEIVGMSQDDFESFDSDEVKSFVYSHAEPPVDFEVIKESDYEGKKVVIIKVNEFERVPIICKKSYSPIIHDGKIYVRSKGKPESIPIPSQSEMRELVEIAVDKEMRRFIERSKRVGMEIFTETDKQKFHNQIEDLL